MATKKKEPPKPKTDPKKFISYSEAHLKMPASERALALQKEKGLQPPQLAVALKAEGYRTNEISHAIKETSPPGTPADFETVNAWLHGQDPSKQKETEDKPPPPDPSKNNNDAPKAEPRIDLPDEAPKDQQQKTQRKADESEETAMTSFSSDVWEPETLDGKVLRKALKLSIGKQGLAANKVNDIVQTYEMQQELYDDDPMKLVRLIKISGVSEHLAAEIVDTFRDQTLPSNPKEENMSEQFAWMRRSPQLDRTRKGKVMLMNDGVEVLSKAEMDARRRRIQAQEEDEMEDRKQQRMINRMMNMQMLRMMMQGQGNGMMGAGMMGPMIQEMEPIFTEDGKPAYDPTTGMPMMRTRMTPYFMTPMMGGGKGDSMTEASVKFIEVLSNSANKSAETSQQLLTTVLTNTASAKDTQIKFLSDRLDAVESSDPTDGIVALLDKLKVLGINTVAPGGAGAPSSLNTEIQKMQLDLSKWSLEQTDNFKRWEYEQREKMLDKEYARDQLKEMGTTIRQAVSDVAGPIASNFGIGLREGMAKNGFPGMPNAPPRQNGQQAPPVKSAVVTGAAAPQQPQPQQPQQRAQQPVAPPNMDQVTATVQGMTPEQLAETLDEADRAEKTLGMAAQTKQIIVQEMHRRGLNV